jgi:hypothetical protein
MKFEYQIPATDTTFQKRIVKDFKTYFRLIVLYVKAKKEGATAIHIHLT